MPQAIDRNCHASSDRDEGGFGMRVSRHRFVVSTLSHVQCYVPRNTTRASTAFTP